MTQGLLIYILRRARKLYGLLAKTMVKLAAAIFARHVTWLYQKDLPGDRRRLFKVFALLEGYSGISSIDVERHLKYIRDKAFRSFPYPSIGRWRFMDFYITELPEYPDIISRLKDGEALLDVGCCFGHILRQIVFDGAPSDNLAGTDLRPEFIELGYELFRDRDTFEAKFVTGDILDAKNAGLATLDGDFDIIHAAAFFHLFDWSTQVKIGERLVRFFKPGISNALLVGRQIGSRQPLRVEQSEERGEKTYLHSIETMQGMWNVIGANTGTRWEVTGRIVDSAFDGLERTFVEFAVRMRPREGPSPEYQRLVTRES